MKLPLTTLLATPGVTREFTHEEITSCLMRHFSGDWGDLVKGDKLANERALKTGDRILSSYKFSRGRKCWVITDACDDKGIRHYTTILLPEEY